MATTLSASNPLYKQLEEYVRDNLVGYAPLKELGFVQRANSDEFKTSSLEYMAQQVPDPKAAFLSIFFKATLSTVYDDPLSSKVAHDLLSEVRAKAILVLPEQAHATYGGFCCAPTSSVNAHAVALPTADGPRVFIVFESGLFTFIHGVLSTLIDVVPEDIAALPQDWENRWSNYCAQNKGLLADAAQALQAWVRFFSSYNARRDLSYVPVSEFSAGKKRMVCAMVAGCELFITAHEYVHAISNHHELNLDPCAVEAEADQGGAKILGRILQDQSIDASMAICGVALFLMATDLPQHQGSHGPYRLRLLGIMNLLFTDSEKRARAEQHIAMWCQVFNDLCANPGTDAVELAN